MSRMYGWKMALALLYALWVGPVAQVWAGDSVADGRQLAVHGVYGCAIEQHGRLGCFGYHESALGPTPAGRYLSVAISPVLNTACAVRSDGEAVCWAKSAMNQLSPPPGPWRSLAVASREACGLRPDGQMVCWGDGGGPFAPPSGPFLALSINIAHGCAIRNDGTLQCWRRYSNDELGAPPAGRFSRVEVSEYHACALRSDGRVLCWGQTLHGNLDAPAEGGFIDVAVGRYNGCALRIDGTAVCWGSVYGAEDFLDPLESPPGTFTELASGEDMACGRRPDGLLECWGDPLVGALNSPLGPPLAHIAVGGGEACALDAAGAAHCTDRVAALRPPPNNYLRLSLGDASACGLLMEGSARCWGAPLGPAPAGPLSEISVGEAHACAVRPDADVVCWGDNAAGQLDVPPGDYRAVLAGDRYSCALSTEGTVTCWGDDPLVAGVPVGSGFRTLLGSDDVICASRETGASTCWGEGGAWLAQVNDIRLPVVAVGDHFICYALLQDEVYCEGDDDSGVPGFGGGTLAIAASGDEACIITARNWMICSGAEDIERLIDTLRIGTGVVAAGAAHTCSLAGDGLTDCWGDNALGQRAAPAVRSRALSAEADHACAVAGDGGVRCWGDDARGGNQPPAGLTARAVDVGRFNGCAVRDDGDAACWGWNVNSQGTPPAGRFHRVATGLNHSCGLRDDQTLACWGYGADGQIAAPAGVFVAVDVGERHSCAIAAGGGLQCWGLDSEGQATPPAAANATYRALSSGAFHNCAIRSDGVLACWGRDDHGQATPPTGRFASVSAGTDHSCAVRDDGRRVCWGGNAAGQSPAIGIGPDALPRGEREQPYEARLAATGSAGYVPRAATFRVVSGTLPAGVALDADGLLHGWPQADGMSDVVIEARDANGIGAERAYRLQIGVPRDTAPPLLELVVTGPQGDDGWYIGDVDIRWLSEGQQSGIEYVSGCEDVVLTQDTVYRFLQCTVGTRGGGARYASRTIKRDATPPRIREWLDPAAPNAEGWFRTPVSVFYDCWDVTSGEIGNCPQAGALSAEGVHVFPTQSIRDRAGNVATTPTTPIRIDMTRPQLTAIMPPAQLFVGATHDFQLSATDALSGIASQSCTPVDTATPSATDPGGSLRQASCTAIDRAGNSTTVTSTYEVLPQTRRTGGAGQPVLRTTPVSRPMSASQRVPRAPQSIRRGVKPAKPRTR